MSTRTRLSISLRWLAILGPLSVVIGGSVAFFHWSLNVVTNVRIDRPWLVYLLPVAGVMIWIMYHRFGGNSSQGTALLISKIRRPEHERIPFIMAPLVLIGTLLTHLCGGSAGREGTAVQIAAGLAQPFRKVLLDSENDERLLVRASVAGGFAAVFGTPLAGVLFCFEFSNRSRIQYATILPCLAVAYLSDFFATAFGTRHTVYTIATNYRNELAMGYQVDTSLLLFTLGAAIAFGLISAGYMALVRGVEAGYKRFGCRGAMRPVVGGIAIILLTLLLGTTAYNGLGVYPQDLTGISIVAAFDPDGVTPLSWFWKLLFTAITIGSGFKGGEVTPLFFIGAALGNSIATMLGFPTDLFTALGMVCVFGAATKTPIASLVLAIEMFGSTYLPYFGISVFVAAAISGRGSVYATKC